MIVSTEIISWLTRVFAPADNLLIAIQKVLNDPTSPNITYDNIIKTITDIDSEYVYVLENTKIIRIHKNTYESEIVITYENLSTNFNLQTWYDFAIFPARTNIPETIFIFGLFVDGINEKFDILSIYPLNEILLKI